MSKGTEKCGCGASVEITLDHQHHVREALTEWRAEHKHISPAPTVEKPVPQPEGNNFAAAERRHETDRNHELNSNDRPGHYGRGISMKWHQPETTDREESPMQSSGGL